MEQNSVGVCKVVFCVSYSVFILYVYTVCVQYVSVLWALVYFDGV